MPSIEWFKQQLRYLSEHPSDFGLDEEVEPTAGPPKPVNARDPFGMDSKWLAEPNDDEFQRRLDSIDVEAAEARLKACEADPSLAPPPIVRKRKDPFGTNWEWFDRNSGGPHDAE